MTPREWAVQFFEDHQQARNRYRRGEGPEPSMIEFMEPVIQAAIDAATKPLREEVERLKEQLTDTQERLALHEQHDEDCPCSVDTVLLHAYSCLDCTCEIGRDFREMRHQFLKANSDAADAEVRNKALVEALREIEGWMERDLQVNGPGPSGGYRQRLVKVSAALAAYEEPKETLPKASERA